MDENRPTDRASAHLVLLPSAAPLPVVQHPRRGRYPPGVISLKQAREHAERREVFARMMETTAVLVGRCDERLLFMQEMFEAMQRDGVIRGERA